MANPKRRNRAMGHLGLAGNSNDASEGYSAGNEYQGYDWRNQRPIGKPDPKEEALKRTKKRDGRTANSESAIRDAGGWGKLSYQQRQFLRGVANTQYDNPPELFEVAHMLRSEEPERSPQEIYNDLGGWSKLNYTDGQKVLKGGKR